MNGDIAYLFGTFIGSLTSPEVLAIGIIGPMLTPKKRIIPITAVACIFAHGLMIGHWYSFFMAGLAGLVLATISYFTIGKWVFNKQEPDAE